MYGKRVDTGFKFVRERLVDHAMTSDSALSPERICHNIDSEVGFSAGPMPGMAFVLVGLVKNFQAQWREAFSQLS